MKSRLSLTWPTVLVAVAALTLGTLGTAVADPVVSKITASKVKKIAKKVADRQITRRAPTLVVKGATELDGAAAATYLDRAAYAHANDSVPLPGSFTNTILGPVQIVVPDGISLLRIDGVASYSGADGNGFGVYYALDGPCTNIGQAFGEAMYSSLANGQGSAGFTTVRPVTAGAHAVSLCSNNAAMNVLNRQISAETIARGPSGGTTLSPLRPTRAAKPTSPGVAPR